MMLNAWTDRSPVETLGLLLGCAVLSCGLLFSTPWIAAPQAPLSMGFRRQEYWRRLPFLSPGDLPNPGIEPRSPALQADSLPSEPPGKLNRDKQAQRQEKI